MQNKRLQDVLGNKGFSIGGWICSGNMVHTTLRTGLVEIPPVSPPPPPPPAPPPPPPPPPPFSQLLAHGFLPNMLQGAVGAMNMPPPPPPPSSKKMRKQESRRVSPELLERMRSLQAGFSQAKRAAELKIIVSTFRQQKRRVSKEWLDSVRSLLTGFTQAQIAAVLNIHVSTFRVQCKKCGALCCFKQKYDAEVQRMRRNQSALEYERRHRELKGRVERLEEDLQVRGDRLYSESAEIGIVGGIHDGMRFPGPAKVKVVAFLEVLSY